MLSPISMACAIALALILDFAALAKGGHDLWASTAITVATLAAALALAFRRGWRRNGEGLSYPLAGPLLLALAAAFASTLGAVNPGESLTRWTDLLCAALYFWAVSQASAGSRERDAFLLAVAPIFPIELAVCADLRARAALALPRSADALRVWVFHKSAGTLVNSAVAAAFLVPWPPILLRRMREEREEGSRAWLLWAAALAGDLLALALTGNTWAWLCLLAAGPWLAGRRPLRRPRWGPRGWAAAAAAAAALLSLKNHMASWDYAGSSYASRVSWWAAACRIFIDYPWTGAGVGNYPSAYLAHKSEWGPIQHTLYAHSLPLTVLAETGLLGAAAAAGLLRAWVRALRRDPEETRRNWPFVLGVALALAHSLASVGTEYLSNLLALAALAALALPASRGASRPPRLRLVVAAAAALAAVPYVLAPWMSSRYLVDGQSALSSGNWSEAERSFSTASELDSRSAEARRGLAQARYVRFLKTSERGSLDEAVSRQREAAELDRLNGSLWGELGTYLLARGDRAEGLAMLERAVLLHSPDRRFGILLRALTGGS